MNSQPTLTDWFLVLASELQTCVYPADWLLAPTLRIPSDPSICSKFHWIKNEPLPSRSKYLAVVGFAMQVAFEGWILRLLDTESRIHKDPCSWRAPAQPWLSCKLSSTARQSPTHAPLGGIDRVVFNGWLRMHYPNRHLTVDWVPPLPSETRISLGDSLRMTINPVLIHDLLTDQSPGGSRDIRSWLTIGFKHDSKPPPSKIKCNCFRCPFRHSAHSWLNSTKILDGSCVDDQRVWFV